MNNYNQLKYLFLINNKHCKHHIGEFGIVYFVDCGKKN